MASLRAFASCIGCPSKFSIVKNFFGYVFWASLEASSIWSAGELASIAFRLDTDETA